MTIKKLKDKASVAELMLIEEVEAQVPKQDLETLLTLWTAQLMKALDEDRVSTPDPLDHPDDRLKNVISRAHSRMLRDVLPNHAGARHFKEAETGFFYHVNDAMSASKRMSQSKLDELYKKLMERQPINYSPPPPYTTYSPDVQWTSPSTTGDISVSDNLALRPKKPYC